MPPPFRYVYNFSYGEDGALALDVQVIQGKSGKGGKTARSKAGDSKPKGKVTVDQVCLEGSTSMENLDLVKFGRLMPSDSIYNWIDRQMFVPEVLLSNRHPNSHSHNQVRYQVTRLMRMLVQLCKVWVLWAG